MQISFNYIFNKTIKLDLFNNKKKIMSVIDIIFLSIISFIGIKWYIVVG